MEYDAATLEDKLSDPDSVYGIVHVGSEPLPEEEYGDHNPAYSSAFSQMVEKAQKKGWLDSENNIRVDFKMTCYDLKKENEWYLILYAEEEK